MFTLLWRLSINNFSDKKYSLWMELFHLGISHGVPSAYPDVFHFQNQQKRRLPSIKAAFVKKSFVEDIVDCYLFPFRIVSMI